MWAKVRKVALWLLLAFIVYAIIVSPSQAADIVRTAFGILATGVAAIGTFFNSLLGRQ